MTPTYEGLKLDIISGTAYLAMRYDGCNHGRFIFLNTAGQLDDFVDAVFQEASQEHLAFNKTSKLNPITDGSVFAFNTPKLMHALETDDRSERLAYALIIRSFPCGKIVFEKVPVDHYQLRHLSAYKSV